MRYRGGAVIGCIALILLSVATLGNEITKPEKSDKAKLALAKFKSSRMEGWAYKPITSPKPPKVKQTGWPLQAMDYFVLSKIEEISLAPAEDTTKEMFIRRATLDAWGMVPHPKEVAAFKADNSPDAYEKLVNRLLASPRFGERQARRWLDLARYADSAGFESDDDRLNMWRYRDYVIKSFNDDKPFNRFMKEQIAGDELWPQSYEAQIATGFLAGYPDSGGFRDLIKRKYEIEIDMVNVVGEALLGASIGCARCHDHKFDKISQKDYFRFQAFFANSAAFEELEVHNQYATKWDAAYQQQKQKYKQATAEIKAKQKVILDQVRADGLEWRRARYFSDARESLNKNPEALTPLDYWVRHRAEFVEVEAQIMRYLRASVDEKDSAYSPANIPLWEAYKKLDEELKQFDHLKPKRGSSYYTTIKDIGEVSPPTNIRFGGIHERPLQAVEPGLPDLWAGNYETQIPTIPGSTGRRAALANWIASDDNPLTARVFVNRVWAQLFASGLAENVGDFGRAGAKPTHPELLDHLASNFIANNWSVKSLYKNIMLSHTYRQSSAERAEVLKHDPKNELLAIFPRKRLDAEQIRDSLLFMSGKLDESMGGPAVFPKIPEHLSKDNKFWQADSGPEENYRRSIYTFVRRSLPFAMTASFDPAEASTVHHKREVSTTPLQALTLLNSEEVFDLSQALAGQIINETGLHGGEKITLLFTYLYSREPSRKEKRLVKEFLSKQHAIVQQKSWAKTWTISLPTGVETTETLNPIEASAFLDLVHVLSSSNDFIYRY